MESGDAMNADIVGPGPDTGKRRILISGSSGLLGGSLAHALETSGDEVVRLLRPESARPAAAESGRRSAVWDPLSGRIDREALEGLDAVVHLAGESVAAGRWTPERKRRIRESRKLGTSLLCEGLAAARSPPGVLISASAVGIYGDRGDEWLEETSASGHGFLADVAREWEAATAAARGAGIRVLHLRLGMVLAAEGGALSRMRVPFRLGLGGRLGSGRQFLSWIAIEDVIGVVRHGLDEQRLEGAVNAVSPSPVRNEEFTRVLGRVLRRPTAAAVPASLLRLAVGEMADGLLLASQRVRPARLAETGYEFRQPDLKGALHTILRSG